MFSNGTVAVNDQGNNEIEFYAGDGTHLQTVRHTSIDGNSSPFGSTVGPDDTLWVGLFSDGVSRFSQDGSFISNFSPGFEVQDLAIDPFDGSVWLPSSTGRVHQFSAEGVELGSFETAATVPFLRGIAVTSDGSLLVTSRGSADVFQYSRSGVLLSQFAVQSGPGFISVNSVPEPQSPVILVLPMFWLLLRRAI